MIKEDMRRGSLAIVQVSAAEQRIREAEIEY